MSSKNRPLIAYEKGDDFIFLSSLLGDDMDMKEERQNIYEYINSNLNLTPLYVDEIDSPKILTEDTAELTEKFSIIDSIVSKIQKCQYIIIIFSKIKPESRHKDHGSLIYNSEVSMWEIELFISSMYNKQIYAIIEDGFFQQERPRLMNCINLIKVLSVKTFENIKRIKFKKIIETIIQEKISTNSLTSSKLITTLFNSSTINSTQIISTDKFLCTPHLEIKFSEINEPLIDAIINRYSSGISQENNLNPQSNIAKLYIGYKELQKAPYYDSRFDKYLLKWNIISSSFATALAWTGIWGHEILGVIYHLNDLELIRERLIKKKISGLMYKDVAPPHGAFASAYYSTAKQCKSQNAKKIMFDKMLLRISEGLKVNKFDEPGLLALRGSYHVYNYSFWKARKDFKKAYDLTQKIITNENQLADIENHYAFSLFFSGNLYQGYKLSESSLKKYESIPDSGSKARAYRKSSIICFAYGKINKGIEYREIAKRISLNTAAFDQYRQL